MYPFSDPWSAPAGGSRSHSFRHVGAGSIVMLLRMRRLPATLEILHPGQGAGSASGDRISVPPRSKPVASSRSNIAVERYRHGARQLRCMSHRRSCQAARRPGASAIDSTGEKMIFENPRDDHAENRPERCTSRAQATRNQNIQGDRRELALRSSRHREMERLPWSSSFLTSSVSNPTNLWTVVLQPTGPGVWDIGPPIRVLRR
jgi:hypothetical protein